MLDQSVLEDELYRVAASIGLSAIGFTSADPFEDAERIISDRVRLGYFGAMKFVMANPGRSCHPTATMARARSVITAALAYWCEGSEKPDSSYVRIARYAWQDHYGALRAKLEILACLLRDHGYVATVLSDSNALVDRAPAVRASLGFFGKNTNVITPSAGSWVVIGSILTDARLNSTRAGHASCGSCTLCLKRCPTSAIVNPGVIDSRRCVAYLLQAPGLIPRAFRRQIGDRLYGCDECQECCPLNRRSVRTSPPSSKLPDPRDEEWISISEILNTPVSILAQKFERFYMPRNDYHYLQRNALNALGNARDSSLLEIAVRFLEHGRPMLRATTAWAMGEIGNDTCQQYLRLREAVEVDDLVRAEITAALAACES